MLWHLIDYLPLRYSAFVPVLGVLAFLLRKAGAHGKSLIFLLFVLACVPSVWMRHLSSPYRGWAHWFDAVLMEGGVNSFRITLYAIGGEEVVRSLFSRRQGGQKRLFMKKKFVRQLLAFVMAALVAAISFLAFGSAPVEIFLRLSDGFFLAVLVVLATDALLKLSLERSSLSALYWVTWGLVLIADIAFCLASTTASRIACLVGLGVAIVSGLASGLCVLIPYVKGIKSSKTAEVKLDITDEDAVAEYRKKWMKVRSVIIGGALSSSAKEKLLSGFLLFKLQGDSVYNDIDSSAPLIPVINDESSYAISLASASDSVTVSATTIAEVTEYIAGLVSQLEA